MICPKCLVDFRHNSPRRIKKKWLIINWEQRFCRNCGIRLVLMTSPSSLGFAFWRVPLFVIKRNYRV